MCITPTPVTSQSRSDITQISVNIGKEFVKEIYLKDGKSAVDISLIMTN